MGQKQSDLDLNIATLNYSGIIASPYQFFETNEEAEEKRNIRYVLFVKEFFEGEKYSKKRLEEQFKKRSNQGKKDEKDVVKWFKKEVKWKMGFVDKQWHSRYSPLYNWKVGIKNNKFIMNKVQFYKEWNKKLIEKNSHQKNQIQQFMKILITNVKSSHKSKGSLKKLLQIKMKVTQQKQAFIQYEQKMKTLMDRQKKFESDNQDKEQIKQQMEALFQGNIDEFNEIQTYLQYLLFQLRTFDYLAYKAILYNIYEQLDQKSMNKLQSLEEIPKPDDERTFSLSAKKYFEIRSQSFQKSYLKQNLKISKTIDAIDKFNIDIFLIQQANEQLLNAIQTKKKQFSIIKPHKKYHKETFSAIIIRQKKFPKMMNLRFENTLFYNNYVVVNKKKDQPHKLDYEIDLVPLNINGNTVIQAIGNLIIVCSHLSSDGKNAEQVQQFKELVLKLEYWFPDANLICGGDLNSEMYFPLGEMIDIRRRVESEYESRKRNEEDQYEKVEFQANQQSLKRIRKLIGEQLNVFPKCPKKNEKPKQKKGEKNEQPKPKQEDKNNNQPKMESEVNQSKQLNEKKKDQSNNKPQVKENERLTTQTTNKKRSFIQAQTSKADDWIFSSKDFIVSNLQIKDKKIMTIDSTKSVEGTLKSQLPKLPNDKHPFDHYLVIGKITLPKNIIHTNEKQYLQKYHPERLTEHDKVGRKGKN